MFWRRLSAAKMIQGFFLLFLFAWWYSTAVTQDCTIFVGLRLLKSYWISYFCYGQSRCILRLFFCVRMLEVCNLLMIRLICLWNLYIFYFCRFPHSSASFFYSSPLATFHWDINDFHSLGLLRILWLYCKLFDIWVSFDILLRM